MAKTLSTEKTIIACPQTEEQIKKRVYINEVNMSQDARDAYERWRFLYTNWVLRTGRTRITQY